MKLARYAKQKPTRRRETMKETIADLKTRIAVLEERLKTKVDTISGLHSSHKALEKKVSQLRGEIVTFKAERDRLTGYVDRIQVEEAPPERRNQERRQPMMHHHADPGCDSGPYGMSKSRDRESPWYE